MKFKARAGSCVTAADAAAQQYEHAKQAAKLGCMKKCQLLQRQARQFEQHKMQMIAAGNSKIRTISNAVEGEGRMDHFAPSKQSDNGSFAQLIHDVGPVCMQLWC